MSLVHCKSQVIVLGDIGRSPRMQNHALSLADDGWQVELIGYDDSAPRLTVQNHPSITIRALPTPWKLPRSPKLLYVLLIIPAAVTRALSLFWALTAGGLKGVLLVQNPPSIPTLLVARLAATFWHGAALAVDWHNYGYTIMETTGAPGLTIQVAKFYEKLVANLTLTLIGSRWPSSTRSWSLT